MRKSSKTISIILVVIFVFQMMPFGMLSAFAASKSLPQKKTAVLAEVQANPVAKQSLVEPQQTPVAALKQAKLDIDSTIGDVRTDYLPTGEISIDGAVQSGTGIQISLAVKGEQNEILYMNQAVCGENRRFTFQIPALNTDIEKATIVIRSGYVARQAQTTYTSTNAGALNNTAGSMVSSAAVMSSTMNGVTASIPKLWDNNNNLVTSFTASGQIKASINAVNDGSTATYAKLYLVSYDKNNTVLNIQTQRLLLNPGTPTDFMTPLLTLPTNIDGVYANVFLWDDNDAPLSLVYKFPVPAPYNLEGIKLTGSVEGNTVSLEWNANPGAYGYKVYRITKPLDGSAQSTTVVATTLAANYDDPNLTTSNEYEYYIRSYYDPNNSNESVESNHILVGVGMRDFNSNCTLDKDWVFLTLSQ